MSDQFFIIPIETLLSRILNEETSGQLFGITRELFFQPSESDPFRMTRYGHLLETPIGVAAGPHTQMTQNIITAWLTGARYLELKTIQTLDQLTVSKPCIDMEDEGYNCEWSQELRIRDSFDQYLNAWILIHVLKHRFGRESTEPGFMFNMSVGYTMKGILSENVQWFLDKMENCSIEKEEKLDSLSRVYPEIQKVKVPNRISDQVTLSTMHGCPPAEIETIARYLIEKRKLHTTVKLNPTLLGPETLRKILNETLHYPTVIPDEAFAHDITYDDAVQCITRLRHTADANGVAFGVKLTNTLESVNSRNVLPENERMIYMSGRALHPLGIALAAKLQTTFDGQLDISFSGGVDCFNVSQVVSSGLKPVTVCSDILKPGGYGRLFQYIDYLSRDLGKAKETNTDNLKQNEFSNLLAYAEYVTHGGARRYRKDYFPGRSMKTDRPLTYFDCIQAPCQTVCPAHQRVTDYMFDTAHGNDDRALDAILESNPFPAVTGRVCDHACMTRCTRLNVDRPLEIRAIKYFAHAHGSGKKPLPVPSNGVKVAIIGAGPSGLSCAYYLALRGATVSVYETHSFPGGMVSDAIPAFRLSESDIRSDITRIETKGVRFFYHQTIDVSMFHSLRQTYHYIYIAVGAQVRTRLAIEGENSPYVLDALSFLSRVRRNEPVDLGQNVLVIGGGNSAIDAARTARRLVPASEGNVTILYRRTRNEMPADPEEIHAAESEGITIMELTQPIQIIDTQTHPPNNSNFPKPKVFGHTFFQKGVKPSHLRLICAKMQLTDAELSGRRRPVKIEGSDFDCYADSVITAVGQQVRLDFIDETSFGCDPLTGQTAIENVFIGGDALHGPRNIITAIADGKRAADRILNSPSLFTPSRVNDRGLSLADYQKKSATRIYGDTVDRPLSEPEARTEASRCLLCNDICNVCVTVCPNRANVSYEINPVSYKLQKAIRQSGTVRLEEDGWFNVDQRFQVLNIADFCNECGNCSTFCPTSGSPYRDKPKICLTRESFQSESHAFFIDAQENKRTVISKRAGKIDTLTVFPNESIYETDEAIVTLDNANFRIKDVTFKTDSDGECRLQHAAAMKCFFRIHSVGAVREPPPNH